MDRRAALNLRMIGFLVVAISILFLLLPMLMANERIKYDDAIASTLAIGIGLLLLAEIGPLIKSLKAGGVEVEFLDTVTGKFNTLEARVAKLEMQARHPEDPQLSKLAGNPKPPGLATEGKYRNDPQKGRFGGEASRQGFTLSATFRNVSKNYVEIVLRIDAPEGSAVANAECVEFYLHHSFNPDVVPAIFHDGVAELTVIAYGGFTVGAWIACSEIALELDLARIPSAPRIVREL